MTGKDYAMSRDAMQTLHEAVSRVYFAKFEREKEDIKGKEIIREICGLVKSPVDEVEVRNKWNLTKSLNGELKQEFEKFKSNREKTSENFKFWNIFLDKIMSVITDLNRSFREADWCLYVSALRRAIPLFFAFGRTNYCRWAPIHYEECLTHQEKYPLLYSAFSQGDFVVHHTVRRASGVPVDQALEQA